MMEPRLNLARERPAPPAGPVDWILVNYRSRAALHAHVTTHSARILDGSLRPVLVDNDPSEPLSDLETWPGGIRFTRNRTNLGFAAAVNQAARLGTAPWILLMNPDVRIETSVLDEIPRVLDVDPRVGMIGGVNEETGGPRTHGELPGLVETHRVIDGSAPWTSDWAAGSFVLVRRRAFETLGGFDETYFMYFEDIDLGRRMNDAGWKVRIDPRLAHRHPGHGSYEGDAARQAHDYRTSKALYLARHGGWLHRRLYALYRLAPGRRPR